MTVVATGLSDDEIHVPQEPAKPKLVASAGSSVDYKRFDMPTVMRANPAPQQREPAPGAVPVPGADSDYLDIPAVLRRQAD